jgi:hypothetical protein
VEINRTVLFTGQQLKFHLIPLWRKQPSDEVILACDNQEQLTPLTCLYQQQKTGNRCTLLSLDHTARSDSTQLNSTQLNSTG